VPGRVLDTKLLRELRTLKGQMISIALVVATGVMTIITMRGSYESLVIAQQAYYGETRFADIWVPLKRAPESIRRKIASLSGVDRVDTRVSLMATLDLEHSDGPVQGRFVSVPPTGRPILNDIVIRSGRYLQPGAANEVLVSKNFADANGFRPGDEVRALINGRAKQLKIVGTAVSPEHTYAVPPGALYPDDRRYGVFWMDRDVLGPAYNMEGAFNEAVVSLLPGVNELSVLSRLDRLLDPYGGLGAYPRANQPSHLILQAELDQNKVMGTVVPIVFLAVAAFLLNLVLGRLVSTQRGEIAVLKAFGYRNVEVGWHYLMFAISAVVAGTVAGTVAGAWLGEAYVDLYGEYFNFPELRYRLSFVLVTIAVFISLVSAGSGALFAVRRAVVLPPAEAMQPEPPARFDTAWSIGRSVLRVLPASGRMILRNIERKPVQSALSSLGVAFSVAILVIGMFMFDGIRYLMDLQFRVIQREDLMVTFNEPLDSAIYYDLRYLEGVTHVETFRTVPVRLRAGHRDREVGLQSMPPDPVLRRIVSAAGYEHPLPSTGIVISKALAMRLRVEVGETVMIEVLEGRRRHATAVVSGIIEDFLGMSAYMSQSAVLRLVGGENVVSGAYLSIAADARNALNRTLRNLPAIAGVTSPASMLESFESQLAEGLLIGIAFLLGFAGVIAVGVIYNGARISLSERGRELASMRVMGFHRREVSMLLLGEQAVITIVAIPLGWLIGYGLAALIAVSLQNEAYRVPFIIDASTYAASAVITIVAAAGSGAIVRHRINSLDLIATLKTRE